MAANSSSVDSSFHEEVVDSLDEHADLAKFTREIAQFRFISQDVKKCFDSLDLSVPHPLQIRYLLLHAYHTLEKGSSKLRERWFKLLAKHGVPSQLVRSIKESQRQNLGSSVEQHHCAVTGDGVGVTKVNIGTKRPLNDCLFSEKHISAITEELIGCSGKWKNIALSLQLPDSIC